MAGIAVTFLETTTDRHGDRTTSEVFTVQGCGFAPDNPSEDTDRQEHIVRSGTLFMPPEAPEVKATHKARTPDGSVWEVDGGQALWVHMWTGWAPGSTVRLRQVRG